MGKVIDYIVYLLTPEASVRYISREVNLGSIREGAALRGLIKSLFWICISVMLSLVISCLH